VNVGSDDVAHPDVVNELRNLRDHVEHVEGSIAASTDGMLIGYDLAEAETYGVEPSAVAALAAVNLGLGQRVTDTASYGELQETLIRGAFGTVITFSAGEHALVAVLARRDIDLDRLRVAARPVTDRVAVLVADAREAATIAGFWP
jgi:predicted regulator of Ras-like GTPase activity (Roadblock/LC7/MglB family)